jgi:hypothetical protein
MINESRLINGTLKLGPVGTGQIDVSCQITNARVTTAYSDDGDALTVLCGDTKPPPRKLDGHKLEGTLVQDFEIPEVSGGVTDYLWNHNLQTVAYEYVPNDGTTCPVLTGTLMLEIPAETYGGDVNARITSDFVWSLQEGPTRTFPGTPLADTAQENPGIAGDFLPTGCITPSLAEMASRPVVADPVTPWGTGSHMVATDGSVYWDGAAWVPGVAP